MDWGCTSRNSVKCCVSLWSLLALEYAAMAFAGQNGRGSIGVSGQLPELVPVERIPSVSHSGPGHPVWWDTGGFAVVFLPAQNRWQAGA